MKLIDAHCHIQDLRILENQDQIIKDANDAGVKYMACCATCEEDWDKVQKLSIEHDSIIPNYGIHPWFVDTLSSNWEKKLRDLLKSETKRLKLKFTPGIGEAGLDFTLKNCDHSLQEKIFTKQLILAKDMRVPISIHIRKAWDLFIHIIKKTGELPAKGLIHSYSGSSEMIPLFEDYGFYISFSGSITRPGVKKVINALKTVSDNRMLIETDSPDILPDMLQKKENDNINKPENLIFIAEIASQIRTIPVKEYSIKTYNNGVRLFNICE